MSIESARMGNSCPAAKEGNVLQRVGTGIFFHKTRNFCQILLLSLQWLPSSDKGNTYLKDHRNHRETLKMCPHKISIHLNEFRNKHIAYMITSFFMGEVRGKCYWITWRELALKNQSLNLVFKFATWIFPWTRINVQTRFFWEEENAGVSFLPLTTNSTTELRQNVF
jgi:hypothetical protein